ncbi:uncharacterized protein [Clytia hemisphaerica]|uniref:uncharacterized protein n=1 Tax=Clytia hemisphaerica TaxID=252671 RepID=UPI0034D3AE5F
MSFPPPYYHPTYYQNYQAAVQNFPNQEMHQQQNLPQTRPVFPSQQAYQQPNQPQTGLNFQQNQQQSEPSTEQPSTSQSQNTTRDSWTSEQTTTLVYLWVENQDMLNSTNANKAWGKIRDAVNKVNGKPKNITKCKAKIKGLKDAYKKCKRHNEGKSGVEFKTCKFYQQLDRVLSDKHVMTMPNVKESGQSKPDCADDRAEPAEPDDWTCGKSILQQEDELIESEDSDIDTETARGTGINDTFEEFEGTDENKKPDGNENKNKRKLTDLNDSKKNKKKKTFHEELLDVQREQIDFFKSSEQNYTKFMRELVKNQQKHDAEEKKRDRDFSYS